MKKSRHVETGAFSCAYGFVDNHAKNSTVGTVDDGFTHACILPKFQALRVAQKTPMRTLMTAVSLAWAENGSLSANR